MNFIISLFVTLLIFPNLMAEIGGSVIVNFDGANNVYSPKQFSEISNNLACMKEYQEVTQSLITGDHQYSSLVNLMLRNTGQGAVYVFPPKSELSYDVLDDQIVPRSIEIRFSIFDHSIMKGDQIADTLPSGELVAFKNKYSELTTKVDFQNGISCAETIENAFNGFASQVKAYSNIGNFTVRDIIRLLSNPPSK